MHTANGISMKLPTQGVVGMEVTSSIEANGGNIRPFHVITIVGEDGIGLGEVGDDDCLECVGLCKEMQLPLMTRKIALAVGFKLNYKGQFYFNV